MRARLRVRLRPTARRRRAVGAPAARIGGARAPVASPAPLWESCRPPHVAPERARGKRPPQSPPSIPRVLVEKLAPPTKTVGGVLLPESATAGKLAEGTVLAVGPGRRSGLSGDVVPVGVKAGDTVLLPEYGGQALKLEGKE